MTRTLIKRNRQISGDYYCWMSINLSVLADIFTMRLFTRMEEYHVYITYKLQIEKWYANIKEGKRPQQYISSFQKHIREIFHQSITFDRRIVDCLCFALLHSNFNQLEALHIASIAQQLQSIRFISYKDLIEVQGLARSTIINKGAEFIELFKELEIKEPDCVDRHDVIQQLWVSTMKLSLSGFWRLVQLWQLKYPLLGQLYQITSICPQVKCIDKLQQLIISLNQEYSFQYQPRLIRPRPRQRIIQKQIQQIIKDELCQDSRKQNKLVSKSDDFALYEHKPSRKEKKQEEQQSKRLISLLDRLSLEQKQPLRRQQAKENNIFGLHPPKALQDQKKVNPLQNSHENSLNDWLLSLFLQYQSEYQPIQEMQPVQQLIQRPIQRKIQRSIQRPLYQSNQIISRTNRSVSPQVLFKEYMDLHRRSSNQVQSYLVDKVSNLCLYFNPRFEKLINSMNSFLECLKEISQQLGLKLGLFGSLRSCFALENDYDIDLTVMGNNSRNEGIQMLDNFKITLQSSLKLGWIKEAYVLTKLTNMPPLMQIKVHENACKEIFDISIEKIDITACNDTAAINSEFLSHYAKIPEICLFCLLVKLWAKTTNVINRYNPTEGLTSYGVILMCLYFLMQTRQINFLRYTPQQLRSITLGSLIPDTSYVQCKAIDQNFVEFMDFYRQGGRFHRQKKIVCLLKQGHQGPNYHRSDYIFNMYDFIDNTNPGRATYSNQIVLPQFQKAYHTIRNRDLESIHSLLTVHRPLPKKTKPFRSLRP